jgi:hypothetical protein
VCFQNDDLTLVAGFKPNLFVEGGAAANSQLFHALQTTMDPTRQNADTHVGARISGHLYFVSPSSANIYSPEKRVAVITAMNREDHV